MNKLLYILLLMPALAIGQNNLMTIDGKILTYEGQALIIPEVLPPPLDTTPTDIVDTLYLWYRPECDRTFRIVGNDSFVTQFTGDSDTSRVFSQSTAGQQALHAIQLGYNALLFDGVDDLYNFDHDLRLTNTYEIWMIFKGSGTDEILLANAVVNYQVRTNKAGSAAKIYLYSFDATADKISDAYNDLTDWTIVGFSYENPNGNFYEGISGVSYARGTYSDNSYFFTFNIIGHPTLSLDGYLLEIVISDNLTPSQRGQLMRYFNRKYGL